MSRPRPTKTEYWPCLFTHFFLLNQPPPTHQSTPKRVPSQPPTAAITSCFTTGRLSTNHTRLGQISLSQQVAHAHPISTHLPHHPDEGPEPKDVYVTFRRYQDTMRATSSVFKRIQY